MSHPNEGEILRVVAETNRLAAPSEADRDRLTGALRARLGTAALPVGLEPTVGGALSSATSAGAKATTGLGRSGWLGVVVGTGVVTGVLGFALGYGMGERGDAGSDRDVAAVSVVTSASVDAVPVASAQPISSAPAPSPAPTSAASSSAAPSFAAPSFAARSSAAPHPQSPREHSGSSVRARSAPALVAWSFADVIERLQRANLALRQGRAPLALIQLSELDRRGGDILREEREVTRVLALCAVGDVLGARRVAAPLLTGSERSIYAPRLDATCARRGVE